jgi:Lrp/AsnC family transcriptional regulator for asnA, asnC and gidA
MKIDETDRAIIRHLRNGRKPFKDIAKDLSLAVNTVRSRSKKLMQEGLLNISGLIDPKKVHGERIIIVGVRLRTMSGAKKARYFSKLKGVVSVCAVTGRFDLILIVSLNDSFTLSDFITQEMDSVKDVLSAETFVVYESINMQIPYLH